MTPFDSFTQPARAKPGWWRILIGLLVISALWLIGSVAVLAGWVVYNIIRLGDQQAALAQMDRLMTGGEPELIAMMLLTFAGVWLGVMAAMAIHGQGLWSLFSPMRGRRTGGFLAGVVLSLIFIGPALATALIIADPVRSSVTITGWAIWLIPLALLIFIQSTGEELIFRGYLQQQLGARSRSWLIWAGIPSLGFGLLHYANADTTEGAIYYTAITALMGLMLATLVWRTGSLWTAAGVHWGNNAFALTVIGPSGILSGTQLWNFDKGDDLILLQVDLVVVAIATLLVVSPLGRIFGDGRNEEFHRPEAERFA